MVALLVGLNRTLVPAIIIPFRFLFGEDLARDRARQGGRVGLPSPPRGRGAGGEGARIYWSISRSSWVNPFHHFEDFVRLIERCRSQESGGVMPQDCKSSFAVWRSLSSTHPLSPSPSPPQGRGEHGFSRGWILVHHQMGKHVAV